MRTRTTNTNTVYRSTPAMSAAPSKRVATLSDLVAFLANPGDLAHGASRGTEEYIEARDNELVFFCQHLRQHFGKQLSGDDFKQVTASHRSRWEGATPLHIAAGYRHPEVLRHMLWNNPEAQSALNQADDSGRTVLDWAEMRPEGKSRNAIVKLLSEYQAVRGSDIPGAKRAPRSIKTSEPGPSAGPQDGPDLSRQNSRDHSAKTPTAHQPLRKEGISARRRHVDKPRNGKDTSTAMSSTKVGGLATAGVPSTATAETSKNAQETRDLLGPAGAKTQRDVDIHVQRSGSQTIGIGARQLRMLRMNNETWRDDMEHFRQGWLKASCALLPVTFLADDQTRINTSAHSTTAEKSDASREDSQELPRSTSVMHLSAESIVFSHSDDKLWECSPDLYFHQEPESHKTRSSDRMIEAQKTNQGKEARIGSEFSQEVPPSSPSKYRHLQQAPRPQARVSQRVIVEKVYGSFKADTTSSQEREPTPHSPSLGKSLPSLDRQINKAKSQYSTPLSTAPDRPAHQQTLRPLTYKDESTRNAVLQTRLSSLADRIKNNNLTVSSDLEFVTLLNDVDKARGHGVRAQTPRRRSRFYLGRAASQVVLNERLRDANKIMKDAVERLENRYRFLSLGDLIRAAEKFHASLDEQAANRHAKYRRLAPKTVEQVDMLTERQNARIKVLLPRALIEEARTLHQTSPAIMDQEAAEKCINNLKAAQQKLREDLELQFLQRARQAYALAFLQLGTQVERMQDALRDMESATEKIWLPTTADTCREAKESAKALDNATAAVAEQLNSDYSTWDPFFFLPLNRQRETNFKTLSKLTAELKALKIQASPSD